MDQVAREAFYGVWDLHYQQKVQVALAEQAQQARARKLEAIEAQNRADMAQIQAEQGNLWLYDSVTTVSTTVSNAWDTASSAVGDWWVEHGQQVLTVVNVVLAGACVFASGALATPACIAGGLIMGGATIANGVTLRDMSLTEAIIVGGLTILGTGSAATIARLRSGVTPLIGQVEAHVSGVLTSFLPQMEYAVTSLELEGP